MPPDKTAGASRGNSMLVPGSTAPNFGPISPRTDDRQYYYRHGHEKTIARPGRSTCNTA